MRSGFDWPRIYVTLVAQNAFAPRRAFDAARLIEGEIFSRGWIAGEVLGDQTALMVRYGLSRGTLREAVRLLEDREVARMRRGPGGGLMVLPKSATSTVHAVADYLLAAGITREHIRHGRIALQLVAEYLVAVAAGAEAERAFSREFRAQIAQRAAVGLWLRTRPGRTSEANSVFVRLFDACFDSVEDRLLRQPPSSMQRNCFPATQGRSRAHQLAHELARELIGAGPGGLERIGTEDRLCERHAVSKEVFRQAIRLLESHGVMASQRGRTHGVRAALICPTAAVERVVAFCCAAPLCTTELQPLLRILSRILRMAFAADATAAQRQKLLSRFDAAAPADDIAVFVAEHLQLQWEIIKNPTLTLMERCATAYNSRLLARSGASYDDSQFHALQKLRSCMQAIAALRYAEADRLIEECGRGMSQTIRSERPEFPLRATLREGPMSERSGNERAVTA